jgi:hypothetical protein
MNYVHRTGTPLKIPRRHTVKQRVMKMGEETIGGIHEMFSV